MKRINYICGNLDNPLNRQIFKAEMAVFFGMWCNVPILYYAHRLVENEEKYMSYAREIAQHLQENTPMNGAYDAYIVRAVSVVLYAKYKVKTHGLGYFETAEEYRKFLIEVRRERM